MEKNTPKTERNFASFLSTKGFVSYFDKIFYRDENSFVYIIKGGSGTGKSSFMKKLYKEINFDKAQLICCSQDPDSLDGVIFEKENKTVALLDGTAPHISDTRLPMLYDKLIDFSEFLNIDGLNKTSQQIKSHYKAKKTYYNKAEYLLKLCGSQIKNALSISCGFVDYSSLGDIFKMISQSKRDKASSEYRVKSAISKEGVIHIDQSYPAREIIHLCGNRFTDIMFLGAIIEYCDRLNINTIKYPSPINPEYCEALVIKDCDIAFTLSENEKHNKNINTCLDEFDSFKAKAFDSILSSYNQLMDLAKENLRLAYFEHLGIEEFYSACMDFSGLNKLYDKTLCEIKEFLG